MDTTSVDSQAHDDGGCATLVVIGTILAVLVRQRFVIFGSVIVAVTALIWFSHVWRQLPTQYEAQGTMACFCEGLLQHDFWHYLTLAGREAPVSFPCYLDTRQPRDRWARIATRPILTSGDQAYALRPTLEVDAVGEPQRWTTNLKRGQKLAFLTRLVDAEIPEPPFAATDSSLLCLVRDAYIAPGVRVVGQGHPRTDREYAFAEVFLERAR